MKFGYFLKIATALISETPGIFLKTFTHINYSLSFTPNILLFEQSNFFGGAQILIYSNFLFSQNLLTNFLKNINESSSLSVF